MYRAEVPQYGTLMELVADVNADVRRADPQLGQRLEDNGEIERLDVERHGAIRLGTAYELSVMRRLFGVMGMYAVGYYDLSVAGVPVHSTAFRPVDDEALRKNPLRIFTSLLRLDLIEDVALRREAAAILALRRIYTDRCLALIDLAEDEDGLTEEEASEFVAQALETFRWHSDATVSLETYERLRKAHPLPRPAHQSPDPAHARHRRRADRDAQTRHRRQGGDRGPAAAPRTDPAAADQLQGD